MKNQYGKVNKWVASAALLVAFSSSAMAADITVLQLPL